MQVRRHVASGFLSVASLVVVAEMAAAQSRKVDTSAFSPVISVAPPGVARHLIPDSTIATSGMPTSPAHAGATVEDCYNVLRDPRTTKLYLLIEATKVKTVITSRDGRRTTTEEAQANYVRWDGRSDVTMEPSPTRLYLRVACGTNDVLGLAHTLVEPVK